jgi:hypothetical protein
LIPLFAGVRPISSAQSAICRGGRQVKRLHASKGYRLLRHTAAIAVVAAGLGVPVASAAPGPAAPTPAQIAALGDLQREADAYEDAARDYRGVLTRIVQHHYEDRRRHVLAGLDTEIAIEKNGLRDAREDAIRKLTAFLVAHAGRDAHPEKTPDAMFRLAALHEERAREATDASDDLTAGLEPAIALYERILREFPHYPGLAGVHYYLGHAYNDGNRVAKAQQVWRALVCHNRYPYPGAAGLPQDHDRAYWQAWRGAPVQGKGKARAAGDEGAFQDPYPDDCQPVPQQTAAGQEPRYLAEVWWLIGDHHFNGADAAGGPFALNRAEAAYRQSLKLRRPPVHGVAMYKLAWTYFKQQRYEASVRAFVDLLRYADEQEALTGDPGADFRAEAYTYIAGALTYLDFAGPAPDEPFAARDDVLDTETDPRAAEQKMRVAILRVQDPRLIPQDRKWSPAVYRALAREYRDLNQGHNLIEVDELSLRKWPMDRDAPVVEDEIAGAWERLAALSREGTSDRREATARALEARTKLSAYVGVTRWTDVHKADPEAIHTAERLARGGLRRAAADHTNAGSALREKGLAIADKASRDPVLEQALGEYRLAAQAWGGLPVEEGDPDAYEARFWLADAAHQAVVIEVALDRSPTAAEVDEARRAAIAVRDSNEDDRYLQPSAQMVVDVAQQVLNDRYKLFERSAGREGIERRDHVKTTGSGAGERVVTDRLPPEVAAAIAAREEYQERVPPARDTPGNASLYAYQIAELYFLYGQLDDAKKRLSPLHAAACGKTDRGFLAWRRLLSIAALEHDTDQVRALAQAALAKGCAVNDGDRALEHDLAVKALDVAGYEDAKTAFTRAQELPDGPDRAAAWRRAAALYRATLEDAPGGEGAPEAAINGAYASKQVGDYDQAIAMYGLFIKAYGDEATLAKLEKGDPSTSPPRAPDPARYAERVGFLERAYGALAAAYVALLDPRRAAGAYDAIAENPRFAPPARRDAARNAALLHASTGDKEKMAAARATFLKLDPPPDQRAEIDWLVAAAALAAWDERGLDEKDNRAARLDAIAAMDAYHAAHRSDPAAAVYVVRAAYEAAKLRRAGRDPKAADGCRSTLAAFEALRAGSPVVEGKNRALGTPEADMAAECAYTLLDAKIKADLGSPRYAGKIDRVTAAFNADLKKAEAYHRELEELIERYASPTWAVAARARQGSLYDACRTGLYFARAPALELYTDQEAALLRKLERIDPDRADAFRQKRVEDWRAARERMLAEADEVMVKRYAEAVIWARAWKTRGADAAVGRLAAFTGILGDARLRQYTGGIVDPVTKRAFEYQDGFFLRTRPGMTLASAPLALPAPRPAAP